MKNKIFAFIFAFLIFLPISSKAATLLFSPENGVFSAGNNFTVAVMVNTPNPINAVSGIISFPANRLEVAALIKTDSVVDLWVQEPSYSNDSSIGNIRFEGVVLNPGFLGIGKVIGIVFRAKTHGAADLKFASGSVLANDGLGTNILSGLGVAQFTLEPRSLPKTIAPSEDTKAGETKVGIKPKNDMSDIDIFDLLPNWIKYSILAFIGAIAIILSIFVISFGAIILIWLWSYVLLQREKTVKRTITFFSNSWQNVKRIFKKSFRITESIGEELTGDIKYGAGQFKEELEEAKQELSLPKVLKDYIFMLKRMIRRFFTKNSDE